MSVQSFACFIPNFSSPVREFMISFFSFLLTFIRVYVANQLARTSVSLMQAIALSLSSVCLYALIRHIFNQIKTQMHERKKLILCNTQ